MFTLVTARRESYAAEVYPSGGAGGTLQERTVNCRRWFLIATALATLSQGWQARVFAQEKPSPGAGAQVPQPPDKSDVIEIPILPEEQASEPTPVKPSLPEVRIPNFATCPITELRQAVPELKHLKAVEDQSKLAALLDGIGDKTVENGGKTPNLISDELVVSEQAGFKTRQNFSYLVLQRALGSGGTVLEEFRVDLKTGEKFQSDDFEKAAAANPASHSGSPSLQDLPSFGQSSSAGGSAPTSQGFVNDWLRFYPSNRRESTFRYLGEQKMNGHRTLVVAFAQKPGAVRLPGVIDFENKTFTIYRQGVAWVDPSDFRIVRLQTDLLIPPAGAPLRQLTADIQFSEIRIAEIAAPLWLPRQVAVTATLGTLTRHETHIYSNYRLFRAHAKILLNP